MPNMKIILNGETEIVPEHLTLIELIRSRDLSGKRYAVEINEQLIPRSQHEAHKLQEGDNVEIVQAIGGG